MNLSSSTGNVLCSEDRSFNGVKIFSATMMADRDRLGEKITDWLSRHPKVEPREFVVTQSSDAAFHCVAITLFFWNHE